MDNDALNFPVAPYSDQVNGQVFYDPHNPPDAVLETKASAQWVL